MKQEEPNDMKIKRSDNDVYECIYVYLCISEWGSIFLHVLSENEKPLAKLTHI